MASPSMQLTDGHIEFEYGDAAQRRAAPLQWQPIDDAIRMPFVYLRRHRVELSLKPADQVRDRAPTRKRW